MDWACVLAYVTETVDRELLARNEYLAAENRILKTQPNGRSKLSYAEVQMAPVHGSAASLITPLPYAETIGFQVLSLRHSPPI